MKKIKPVFSSGHVYDKDISKLTFLSACDQFISKNCKVSFENIHV